MWLLLTPYTSNPQTTTYKKELSPKSGSRTPRIRPMSRPTSNQLDSTSFLPLLPLRKACWMTRGHSKFHGSRTNGQRGQIKHPWFWSNNLRTPNMGRTNKHWHASAIRTHRTWQWTLYPPIIDSIQNHSNISSMLSTRREFDCCGKIRGENPFMNFQMWFDGMIWSSRPPRPSIVWWRT